MSLAFQQPLAHRSLPSYTQHYSGGNQYPMDRSSDYKPEYNQQGLHPQQQYQGYSGPGPDSSSYPPERAPYGGLGRGSSYPEYSRPYDSGRLHQDSAPAVQGMNQPQSALPPLAQHLHRPAESEGTDDGSSIAAPSPQYPPQPPYSPYPPGHDMQQHYGHQNPGWRPGAWPGYEQQPHLQSGYSAQSSPSTSVSNPSPNSAATSRPLDKARRKNSRDMPASPSHPLSQVYSFVPIPGAQQHKRPRRRYEEIERMYKCGWQGCEKAYGTLNHLNAHVTMQSHGSKRTPEEFKEIRKEWKLRKKEEENLRKQQEEEAARQRGYDGPPEVQQQPSHGVQYAVQPRQLPPIGYQHPPTHYPPPPSGLDPLQYNSQQMYSSYPPAPYQQAPPQGYQSRAQNAQDHDGEGDLDGDNPSNYAS